MKLLTFGCSWTFGVGAGWQPDMSEDEYKSIAWTEESEKHSFRRKLSKKYNLKNINHSLGASSNARNFRIARELFTDANTIANLKGDTIVLWGITSTARSEFWDSNQGKYVNFKLGGHGGNLNRNPTRRKFSEFYIENIYDHDREVIHLQEQMLIWNVFFEYHGIQNIWYDTFNTHEYSIDIPNLIRPNDLLTEILNRSNIDYNQQNKFYHMSSWIDDDPRINRAKPAGLVNPFTFHPTQAGHNIMVDILAPYIEERINE